ncbi:hypothetical protein V2J09_005561 [Rumex salicifolius]
MEEKQEEVLSPIADPMSMVDPNTLRLPPTIAQEDVSANQHYITESNNERELAVADANLFYYQEDKNEDWANGQGDCLFEEHPYIEGTLDDQLNMVPFDDLPTEETSFHSLNSDKSMLKHLAEMELKKAVLSTSDSAQLINWLHFMSSDCLTISTFYPVPGILLMPPGLVTITSRAPNQNVVSLFFISYDLPATMVLQNDIDLLNPPVELEKKKHKLKRLVQSPNSFFMDVKCQGCFNIVVPCNVVDMEETVRRFVEVDRMIIYVGTTVFSHSQTVVVCGNCQTVLCQPTGGRARLTEGCSFRKKVV